jgi:transcriptional regulator with XRE-family HTH domain
MRHEGGKEMNVLLKMALVRSGKRQVDLARHTGIGRSTLSRIVNEYRLPSLQEMVKIAHALGCEIGELWPDHAA